MLAMDLHNMPYRAVTTINGDHSQLTVSVRAPTACHSRWLNLAPTKPSSQILPTSLSWWTRDIWVEMCRQHSGGTL
jgi:hypothetical protein